MKRVSLAAAGMVLVLGLVLLSVWAFNRTLVLERIPGGTQDEVQLYRMIQYGALGLVVLVLAAASNFYRLERKEKAAAMEAGRSQGSGVMGWKGWGAIFMVLGVLLGGVFFYFGGDNYAKDKEGTVIVRDNEGNIMVQGTLEEVREFMARRKQPVQRLPEGESPF